MSALFRSSSGPKSPGDWAKIADRRTAPTVVRLRAGLYLRYHYATGAGEFDTFVRDSKTWAVFEHAALPELSNFQFVDKSRQTVVTGPAVLADAMYQLWSVDSMGRDLDGRPTTIGVVGEIANYLCSVYDTTKIDRRAAKRNWFGLNSAR